MHLASSVPDQLKRTINVVGGLGVEGDVGSTGINKVTNSGIDGGNHQVDIDGSSDSVITKSLAHHGSNGKVGNVVVVHDVEVDDISTGLEHVVDFFSELGEVGGKDGGGDEVVFVSPDVQGSGGAGGGGLFVR